MAVVGRNPNVDQGLNSLIEIRLIECSECEVIPMLGHLPNLKSIRLQGLKSVKGINSSFYGEFISKDMRIVFPVLERLEMVDMSGQSMKKKKK